MSSGMRPHRRPLLRGGACPSRMAVLLVVAGATLAAAPAPAAAGTGTATTAGQQEAVHRLRQLELFEQVLGETIQEYVQARVQQLLGGTSPDAPVGDEETLGRQGGGAAREAAAQAAGAQAGDASVTADGNGDSGDFVVKVGRPVGAHGVYIDGYGVLVTLQRPQVAVVPRSIERRLAAPFGLSPFQVESEGTGNAAFVNPQVIELRTRMIENSLRELEELLARQRSVGAAADQIERRRAQIERVRALLDELAAGETTEDGARAGAGRESGGQDAGAAGEAGRPGEQRRRAARYADRHDTAEGGWESMIERQRSLGRMLERAESVITQALTDAAIETLAHYGSIIKGIDADERLSVLVTPPHAPELGRHFDRRPAPPEFLVSVRYGDIRELDDGKIDAASFRERVSVRGRLGEPLPRPASSPEAEQP